MNRQRVPMHLCVERPKPLSRPLQTGRRFALVVPDRRVFSLSWDEAHYEPGQAASVSIQGNNLGAAPLRVLVEAEAADGSWSPVAQVLAEVSSNGKTAVGVWRVPAAAVVPGRATVREVDGSELRDAHFEDAPGLHRDGPVWMVARASGFDGRLVQVVLEREDPAGHWVPVGEAVATVQAGTLRAAVTLLHGKELAPLPKQTAPAPSAPREADGARLSDARFEDPQQLEGRGPVWLAARAPGFEGRCVQLVLEQETGPGEWRPIGQATTTVRAGAVHAAVMRDPDAPQTG